MDISLLPEIRITTSPTFPRCKGTSESQVVVNCEIKPRNETFNVTWTSQGITADLVPFSSSPCLVFVLFLSLSFFFLFSITLQLHWENLQYSDFLFFFPASTEGMKKYGAVTAVNCTQSTLPSVTCNFRNRCNQKASATKDILIINGMVVF